MVDDSGLGKSPFHPLVRGWFAARFGNPTPPQSAGWEQIAAGRDTLIAAPTGSGKTLAAFLWSIDRLFRRAAQGSLPDRTSVVYVSPLKALGNDIEKNLREPLQGIVQTAQSQGITLPEIRVAVRSGDTPMQERRWMLRRPPHILITTPESLYILLTAAGSRNFLRSAQTVIVDEIHAVAGDKRGAHLALTLERLDNLAGERLQRIGLSATQKPITEIARLLVGAQRTRTDGAPQCAIVDAGHQRDLDLSIEIPDQEVGAVATHEFWDEVYDRIAARVRAHRTTLVFVNTRRLVERVSHQLTTRLGEGRVLAHHGSLSRKTRLEAEQKLKGGEAPVMVATASMELGVDIGHVDLVCHIGAPRALATLLQRVGRSGHWMGAVPKGVLYPLTRDDLLQCAAAVRGVRGGELDRVVIPEKPLDILAQQMVATVAGAQTPSRRDGQLPLLREDAPAGIEEEELWRLVRRAYPYRDLTREEFDRVLHVLSEGIADRRGRRGAHIHRDRVNGRLRPRRGARLAAITNGGAIPDTADYDVIAAPSEIFVGKVNEDFAVESMAGDIFLLGNQSWKIRRVSGGKVWVEDAHGAPPTVPFWLGEAPSRTPELSRAVSELRQAVADRLSDPAAAARWLEEECGAPAAGAEQMVTYLAAAVAALGRVPTTGCVVAERFFDEAGGMQLVLHAPFGGRINRAWGLALRKRFCLNFDFELQAAATDDGVVLSLTERHSFPLDSVFSYVRPATLEKDLVQAALAAPMFTNRWRWNATRALALERFRGGRKVPMAIQRMRAEDLLSAVFPEQVMCQDNRTGPVTVPDHPLTRETIDNCLREAMDVDGLREILTAIGRGEVRTAAVETPAPSPMAHEILNANPYAFLDDAPLEERRARAVALRRTDPDLAAGMGALSPEAVAEVRAQARPDVRDADELHDLLLSVVLLPVEEAANWRDLAVQLVAAGRATLVRRRPPDGSPERCGYAAAERLPWVRALFPEVVFEPALSLPAGSGAELTPSPAEVLRRIVHGWLDLLGPVTVSELASRAGLAAKQVETALVALEASGVVLRGHFSPGKSSPAETEWCERRLLARIHRLTVGALRREIEPVSAADFLRFLTRWQHLLPGARLHGRDGLLEIIGQLQGLELPAHAWERHVFAGRMARYDPEDLESLCLSGLVAWGKLKLDGSAAEESEEEGAGPGLYLPPGSSRRRRQSPTRSAPISFVLREHLENFLDPLPRPVGEIEGLSGRAREAFHFLQANGASFLPDIARGLGCLKSQAEEALWELVARGLATGDGITGLRTLLSPEVKRRGTRTGLRSLRGGRTVEPGAPAGRWSLWRPQRDAAGTPGREKREEAGARQLLRRYGVVFRELLVREARAPSWRALLQVYRRLEARGEIRGGRFVGGFLGEQFALPEAVEGLRAVRRTHTEQETVIASCADPLNLVGIVTPGPRVSPYSNQAIAYRDGTPLEVGALGKVLSRLQGKPA